MECCIKTNNLSKNYADITVVDNVNLHVPTSKIYGLLGRNGAGKTTTMKMLLGLTSISNGDIEIFGKRNREDYEYSKIGSIIETPGFYSNLTARDNLRILAKLRKDVNAKENIERALKLVGLDDQEKKIYSKYSLGMKQRLGIAAAVMHNPKLLILDEPINGLDPIGISQIREVFRELSIKSGVTILISSHVLSEIELIADVIGVMNEGRLIEELNTNKLEKKLKKNIEIEVSNTKDTCRVLESILDIHDYKYSKNYFKIGIDNDIAEINRTLVENGIDVYRLGVTEERLEEYFSNLIGGGSIG